jgi:hypothetical protein
MKLLEKKLRRKLLEKKKLTRKLLEKKIKGEITRKKN